MEKKIKIAVQRLKTVWNGNKIAKGRLFNDTIGLLISFVHSEFTRDYQIRIILIQIDSEPTDPK